MSTDLATEMLPPLRSPVWGLDLGRCWKIVTTRQKRQRQLKRVTGRNDVRRGGCDAARDRAADSRVGYCEALQATVEGSVHRPLGLDYYVGALSMIPAAHSIATPMLTQERNPLSRQNHTYPDDKTDPIPTAFDTTPKPTARLNPTMPSVDPCPSPLADS